MIYRYDFFNVCLASVSFVCLIDSDNFGKLFLKNYTYHSFFYLAIITLKYDAVFLFTIT